MVAHLASVARSARCWDLHDTLHHPVMRFSVLGFRRAGTAAGAVSDHYLSVEALRTSDPDTADAAAYDHMHRVRERMRAVL